MEDQSQAQAQGQGSNGSHQQMGQQEGDELDRELAGAAVAGDEGFEDDDMLDKMSSSPSIADGEGFLFRCDSRGVLTLGNGRGYRL